MNKYMLGLITSLFLVGCGPDKASTTNTAVETNQSTKAKEAKDSKDSKDSKEPPTAPKHYME